MLRGDAGAAAEALLAALRSAASQDGAGGQGSSGAAALLPGAAGSGWAAALGAKVAGAREKLTARLAATAFPLNYYTALRVVRDEVNRLAVPPVVVSEGANTMDNAR